MPPVWPGLAHEAVSVAPVSSALEARLGRIDQQLGSLLSHNRLPRALTDPAAMLIPTLSVTAAYIADATITNAKIVDATIQSAKIASLNADKIVAGSGIINNLTINAVLTIGAGGSIVDADGSTWDQNVLRLSSSGAVGDALLFKVGASDRAYISANSSNKAIFGLHTTGPTNPTSLLLQDGAAVLGFEGLGFNTLLPHVQVDTSGVAITGLTAPSYGGGSLVMFLSEALSVPSSNPTGGGILYVQSGALKYRGTSGTVTTVAAA